jgi:hypothetical protein
MQFTNLPDDPEDTGHSPARAGRCRFAQHLGQRRRQPGIEVDPDRRRRPDKSHGLIADGIHSLSDLVADFVVLLANHLDASSLTVDESLRTGESVPVMKHAVTGPEGAAEESGARVFSGTLVTQGCRVRVGASWWPPAYAAPWAASASPCRPHERADTGPARDPAHRHLGGRARLGLGRQPRGGLGPEPRRLAARAAGRHHAGDGHSPRGATGRFEAVKWFDARGTRPHA